MRAGTFLLLLMLAASSLFAQDASDTDARSEHTADDAWRELLARAQAEKKPVVVFFRGRECGRCHEFETVAVPHPTIARRLTEVLFAMLPAEEGEALKWWRAEESGVALFDRSGALRARWPMVPDTTNFGIILDSAVAVAPQFERALQLAEAGAPHESDLALANALARLGRTTDARAALDRARKRGNDEVRQRATIANAMLDADQGNATRALRELERIAATAATRTIGGEAWMSIAAIHRAAGANEHAARAVAAAVDLFDPASPEHAAARKTLAALRARNTPRPGAIRILPLGRQVVSGKQIVRTHIASAAVARVTFSLDDRAVARADRPPFSATLDFGDVPERHAIRVIAFDRRGVEVGRDERVVNEAGETFAVRLVTPRDGAVAGQVRVSMNLRAPAARGVRVVVSWNDAERAVLTAAPWEATISVPAGQAGVLRVVAELEDGRTSEDAVLLNAGTVERADVQLVELPITLLSRNGSPAAVAPHHIVIREGNKVRTVESVTTAAETPLTVGLLIDVSASMQKSLPDLQEAAIRFLEAILGDRDRAFLIAFDSRARLLQPATSDVALLRERIMDIRPEGLTALHDAMVLGLLQFEGIKGRRAMIVFTDGRDRTSDHTAAEVSELARRVSVPVHVFTSIPWAPPNAEPAEAPNDDLMRVALTTGGTSHTLKDLGELPHVYARIGEALRAQILAFVRTEPATRENEWRSVRIAVPGKDLEVYAPEGYYASW